MNMQLLNAVSEFYTQKFDPGSAEAVNKALSFGLPFSLFGFAVVFGVLAVIMFIVKIFLIQKFGVILIRFFRQKRKSRK